MELLTVAYGMGTNSTALICGLKERGIVPHLITTADTGGERPDTYEYCTYFSAWCVSVGFPPITTVRRTTKDGVVETLEELCLKHNIPGKSSCFFCPANRKPELVQLQTTYPELVERALEMEGNANLTTVKGLGRRFNWGEFLQQYNVGNVCATNEDTNDVPCGCYDDGGE